MVFIDCVAFYYEAGSRGENYLHKDNFHIQVSEELDKLTVHRLRRILRYVVLFFPKTDWPKSKTSFVSSFVTFSCAQSNMIS